MNLSEKKKWILIIYSMILYFILIHIKNLLLFYNIDFAYTLSTFILYGGIVYFIVLIAMLIYLGRKYKTPDAVILRDKQLLIPIIIAIILGIGVHVKGFVKL